MSVVGELETSESTIEWKTENFSEINATIGVEVCSPIFTTMYGTKKITWKLEFFPGGRNEESKDYVGLFLHCLSDWEVSVCYELSILDVNRKKVMKFSKERQFLPKQSWGCSRFSLKTDILDERKKVLKDDTLIISCSIKNTLTNIKQYNEVENDNNNAKAYFEQLLESGELSDVTFEIENKQMKLHKTIVASLSPVFLAMFRHEMKEKKESVVRITDVKYEVMKELFRYIYVREMPNMVSMVDDLFVAADKYAIPGLKKICEKKICKNLNENNALQYLEFAVKYNTTLLKTNVIEYIMNRLSNFVNTPEFEKMDGGCKDELIRAIAKKFRNK